MLGDPVNLVDPAGKKVGLFLACQAINGAMTTYSFVDTASDLTERNESIRYQLRMVDEEIESCPKEDVRRLAELWEIRTDLVGLFSEVTADNTPVSMDNIGPGIVGAGLCGVLLVAPVP